MPLHQDSTPIHIPTGLKKSKKSPLRKIRTFFTRLFKRRKHLKNRRQSARKPVIYVFTPNDADVSIAINLNPAMEFTATYPIVPVQQLHPTGQKIQWDVSTGTDGTLVEQETGLELSSLFWEAELSPRHPVFSAPRADSHEKAGSFDVATWDLCDSDSVVLPVEEVTAYLEKALKGLGLHTEARTSFITFWLPSFLKHRHLALRFIPQADYSRMAPLDIKPEPDVVTRVFMIFKGVLDPGAWPSARQRALDDISVWADIVGVDAHAAFNKDLSRVLEWGALEIPM